MVNTTFSYDANGNMTAGNGLAITYTAFNKPATVTRGTNQIGFAHDPEHQRFKQISGVGDTLYLNAGGVMSERLIGSGGVTQWTDYLMAGGEMVGMQVQHSTSGTYTRYFHKDHLGSISTITDETGAVVERLSYDAWGKRRQPNGQDDPAGSIVSQTSRGFTGHEMLADVGLVHMNGRVYDPMLGRFGTPDPMTEIPYSTQGWNRYTYVGNSPLNFADPSGYCFLGCFWQAPFKALGAALRRTPILGNILQVAATAICTASIVCAPLAPVVAGLTSAVVTGLASGDLGQALKAGFISAATAFAFRAVGNVTGGLPGGHADGSIDFGSEAHLFNIAGHAAVGCGSSVVSGGKCGSGALSGAVGSLATPLTEGLNVGARAVALSTVGGVASVAGGGKFANGALTVAFGYLFNHLGHMLVGTDAHYQLLKYLQQDPIEGGRWSGNISLGGLFDGRPDLLYNDGSGVLQVYEIKPEGLESAGAVQLAGYLKSPGIMAMVGDFYNVFHGQPQITLTGGWFNDAIYTYKPTGFPGVIGYNVTHNDVFTQALRLFLTKPKVGPLALPPRIPPVLVP